MPPTDPAPSRLRPALIALLSSVALIALAEVALRGAGLGPAPRDFSFMNRQGAPRRPGQLLTSSERFFELAPEYRHSSEHAGYYALGTWPFRGRAAEPAPDGLARVAFFGDSCVYGLTVDAADTLPQAVEAELAAAGRFPTDVQVLNFGCPGYTTVQIRSLFEEVVERWKPDVCVFYPAAWNDQVTAVAQNDLELLAEIEQPSLFERVRRTALFAGVERAMTGPTPEVSESPGHAMPLTHAPSPGTGPAPETRRTRVPARAVSEQLDAIFTQCAALGIRAIAIAPAHPPGRDADIHPRVHEDAAAVAEVSRAAGVPLLDARELFAAHPAPDSLFSDVVHPAPPGMARLAAALAPLVLEALPSAAPVATLAIAQVTPAEIPALGDVRVRIEFAEDIAGDLPQVVLGGAALLDLVAVEAGVLEGTAIANREGPLDLLVQSARGCAWLPGAVIAVPPTLEITRETPPTVTFHSRPGDRVLIGCAWELRERPIWTGRGALWLENKRPAPINFDLVAGPDGSVTAEFPALPTAEGEVLYLQGLVFPRSETPPSLVDVWSSVARLPLE